MIGQQNWGAVAQCHMNRFDCECFMVGKIIWSNEQWFLLHCISPHAHWDGFALLSQAELHDLQIESAYCKKLLSILNLRNEKQSISPCIKSNPVYDIFDYAKSNNFSVALELCQSTVNDVIGKIINYSDGVVQIQQFDDDGNMDGESWITVDKITGIILESEELEFIDIAILSTCDLSI